MRTLGFFGIALSLAACGTATNDSASSASDLATTTTGFACSDVVTTDDGAFAVYAECPIGPTGHLVRMEVATGRRGWFAEFPATDQILKVGTAGKLLYWATEHANGTRDFSAAEIRDQVGPPVWVSNVSAPVTFPLHDIDEPTDVLVTANRQFVIIGTSAGGQGNSLVVGRFGSTTPLLETKLSANTATFKMWPGSNRRTVAITDYSGASWRLLDLAASTPALGSLVKMQGPPGFHVWDAIPSSFDGSSFVARLSVDHDYPIVVVRATTGEVRAVASGFDRAGSLFVRDGYLVHTSRRNGGVWTLESLPRNGGAVRTIATDPTGLVAQPSRDGSSVVFVAGERSGFDVNALGVAPMDGTSPARIVVSKEEKLGLELHVADVSMRGSGANRQLVDVRNTITRERSLRLIDEASGVTLGSWREGIDYDAPFRAHLSGNGATLSAEKSCNSIGEGPDGTVIMQLWPSPGPMTGCNTAPIEDEVTIPESGAFVYVSYPSPQRTVTVVRP